MRKAMNEKDSVGKKKFTEVKPYELFWTALPP